MKLSECIKELQVKKGDDFFPFIVPFKLISQIKLRFFPSTDFPLSGWSFSDIGGDVYLIYHDKMYLKVDRFGLVHDTTTENLNFAIACQG